MQNTKNEEQLIVAKICLLGFTQKETKQKLTKAIQEQPDLMTSLEALIECAKHKDYQLSLSQISKIALHEHGIENLKAFKVYYPRLKKKGFMMEMLLDMLDNHAPYELLPALDRTLQELKPHGWSDKSIKKLFSHVPNLEKLDLCKKYFFQFQEWDLSNQQIKHLIKEQSPSQLETLVSNINVLKAKDYRLSTLFDILWTYGAEHLNALSHFTNTSIAKYYTRNEILAMTQHADGCLRLEALQLHYRDLAAMGHTAIKIKSIILNELYSPDSFIHQNIKELDTYLQEMHHEREKWFQQEQYSMFASSEKIDERFAMYLEDLQSKKIHLFSFENP